MGGCTFIHSPIGGQVIASSVYATSKGIMGGGMNDPICICICTCYYYTIGNEWNGNPLGMDHGVDRGSDRRMDHRTGSMDRRICLYIKQDIILCGPVLRSILRVLRSTLWGHPGPDPRSTTFTPHFTIYIHAAINVYSFW